MCGGDWGEGEWVLLKSCFEHRWGGEARLRVYIRGFWKHTHTHTPLNTQTHWIHTDRHTHWTPTHWIHTHTTEYTNTQYTQTATHTEHPHTKYTHTHTVSHTPLNTHTHTHTHTLNTQTATHTEHTHTLNTHTHRYTLNWNKNKNLTTPNWRLPKEDKKKQPTIRNNVCNILISQSRFSQNCISFHRRTETRSEPINLQEQWTAFVYTTLSIKTTHTHIFCAHH